MDNELKTGKEVLDDFFTSITSIGNVDLKIAEALASLYAQDKFTDRNVINALQQLKEENGNKN